MWKKEAGSHVCLWGNQPKQRAEMEISQANDSGNRAAVHSRLVPILEYLLLVAVSTSFPAHSRWHWLGMLNLALGVSKEMQHFPP